MVVALPCSLFSADSNVPTSIEAIQRITPEELKKLIVDKANIIVVDNQPKIAYDVGHIIGAINLPWAPDLNEEDLWQVPQNKPLILYCACTHEEDAGDVAMQLIQKFGFKDVKLLRGGWTEWQKLGYPIEKAKGK
jgi:sulfur-carrier protein adenylyltransferase/sulfurtransferase